MICPILFAEIKPTGISFRILKEVSLSKDISRNKSNNHQVTSMIKNIIFDLGGVVVDWNPRKILQTFQGNPQIIQKIQEKGIFSDCWRDYDKGLQTRQETVQKIASFVGCSEKECDEFVEFIKYSLVPILETEHFIQQLYAEGYFLYCLSNMSLDFYEYLKSRPVFHCFHGQVISAIEKMVKPDPEIYKLILQRYELLPQESLFIDDLESNVWAAQQVGLHTVHFTDRDKAYHEIRSKLPAHSLQSNMVTA